MRQDITECAVITCENKKYQGAFIGTLCKPCHEEISTVIDGAAGNSAFSRFIKEQAKELMYQCEMYILHEKYGK